MIKYFSILIMVWVLHSLNVNGQNVGIGTSSPHPSARVEIRSDTSGLLIPRVDSPNLRVNNPAAGLMVYNSTNNIPSYFNGTQWMGMGVINTFEQFPRTKVFLFIGAFEDWTVPAGVSKVWIEGWSSGGGGKTLITPNSEVFDASGGSSGSYLNAVIPVAPGDVLSFSIPQGLGAGSTIGDGLFINLNNNFILGLYSSTFVAANFIHVNQFISGRKGKQSSFDFVQLSTTEFRKIIHCGQGAGSFPASDGASGTTVSIGLPSGAVLGYSGTTGGDTGVFPGGGGGGGYPSGGSGANGFLILRY